MIGKADRLESLYCLLQGGSSFIVIKMAETEGCRIRSKITDYSTRVLFSFILLKLNNNETLRCDLRINTDKLIT